MIPSVFFIGATKCATTTLHSIFHNHCKDVYCGVIKENRFFSKIHQEGELSELYPSPGDAIISADFQPTNCVYPWAATRIKEVSPNAKIILCIREPIARAYSEICHFKQRMRGNLISEDPNEIIMENLRTLNTIEGVKYPFLEMSDYNSHIERFNNFETKVVIFEELIRNDKEVIGGICDFIGIERFDYEMVKTNSKSDSLFFSPDVVIKLLKFFKPKTIALSECLDKDLFKIWYRGDMSDG